MGKVFQRMCWVLSGRIDPLLSDVCSQLTLGVNAWSQELLLG